MDEPVGSYEVAAYVGQQQHYSGMDQPNISYSSNGSQSASWGMGFPETVDAFVGTRRALPGNTTSMDPRAPRRRIEQARMDQARYPPSQPHTLVFRPPFTPVPPPTAKAPCETVRTICNLLYLVSIILLVSSQSIVFLYNVVSILCNR